VQSLCWGGRAAGTAALVLAVIATNSAARADSDGLYETQRVERALRARALEIDPDPEGKRIAFIQVAREDVFVDDEIWPTWPNLFHWLTDENTIRRELLLDVGERYETARVEETMRNMRQLATFALVRIVPVKARQPGTVGLLVYTRDLWSLRLETNFSGTADALYLTAQLIERNFLGRNKAIGARFHLEPKSFSVGELYTDSRVLGGDLTLSQSFDVIFNSESGKTEGSQGTLSLSRQFRDLRQRWGWSTSAKYARYVKRSLVGSEIQRDRPNPGGRPVPCEPEETDPACLRSVWDDQSYAASVSGSYRRGVAYKQTFSLGLGFGDYHVAPNAETALAPGQEQAFELLLPRERRQIYPFTSYSLWVPSYVVFRNLSTFGKSENVRVGPVLGASLSLPLEAFGSSTNSVRVTGDLGYVLGDGQTLAEASLATEARLEEGQVVDQRADAVLRAASPEWFAGRFVLYASWNLRRRDTSQPRMLLGADNGLRGYDPGEWRAIGGSRLRGNVEYRTSALVVEAVHLGGVVFYDAGSVYTDLDKIDLHHSAGLGMRLLFPQFNPTPFRLDFGVPLDQEGFTVVLSYGSDQAVPLTASDDAASTSTL
jgi:hypothetical protein